jgi:serpin B
MRNLSFILAATAILTAVVSCDKIGGGRNEDNPRKPLELDTKSAEFLQKGNTFALEFLSRVDAAEKEKDYIVSPLSMQFLLGMVLNGAQGETADEICRVLGYGAGEVEAVNNYNLSLLQQLPKMDKKTKLSIANAIFVNQYHTLEESYVEDVEKYYLAEATNLNFGDRQNALNTINGWCDRQTNGMIPKVLDSVSDDVLAYLMNAMYFKSEWREKFEKSKTATERFTDEIGNKFDVKMMKNYEDFGYYETDIYQVVEMGYGNGAYSMVVFLPKAGYKVADVVAALKTADTVVPELDHLNVDLWLPRFETKYHAVVKDLLTDMGMPQSFGAAADFQAMSPRALYLDNVFQDAIIKVDEEGTEAAVVSTAVMYGQGFLPHSAVFHADHPFLYLITESSTGAILFAGRYSGK